jgi:hypothetical protein
MPANLSTPAATAKQRSAAIRVSPLLAEVARLEGDRVFDKLASRPEGLTRSEAEERLANVGPNVVAAEKKHGWLWRLLTRRATCW